VASHFVSTSYTDNSLEYSVVQIVYTNNSTLTNKTYTGKKVPTASQGASWVLFWVTGVNGDILNPGITINGPATGRVIDLKRKTIQNKLHTVTGNILKILVEQLQIHPLPFTSFFAV
jgi:hypothetical protein